jgi:hypothetical protein
VTGGWELTQPLELLRSERGAEGFAMMPSVNTLTFFQGDPAVAYEHLCERLKVLVAANPWLCARFKRDPDMPVDNCLVLMVPKRPDWTTLLAQVCDHAMQSRPSGALSKHALWEAPTVMLVEHVLLS